MLLSVAFVVHLFKCVPLSKLYFLQKFDLLLKFFVLTLRVNKLVLELCYSAIDAIDGACPWTICNIISLSLNAAASW